MHREEKGTAAPPMAEPHSQSRNGTQPRLWTHPGAPSHALSVGRAALPTAPRIILDCKQPQKSNRVLLSPSRLTAGFSPSPGAHQEGHDGVGAAPQGMQSDGKTEQGNLGSGAARNRGHRSTHPAGNNTGARVGVGGAPDPSQTLWTFRGRVRASHYRRAAPAPPTPRDPVPHPPDGTGTLGTPPGLLSSQTPVGPGNPPPPARLTRFLTSADRP